MSQFFRPMKLEDIGSGIVNRRVRINGRERVRGEPLTLADITSIATANRNAMIENRIISVYPKSVPGTPAAAQPRMAAVEGGFHIVALGFGKYNVIKGIVMLADAAKDKAAEFVAAQEARRIIPVIRGPKAAQEAAAGPGKASRPRVRRKKPRTATRRRRPTPAAPPPAGSEQENGPV